MEIAHIMSIHNQHLYQNQSLIMILGHLMRKGLYDRKYFNNRYQYVIMDNGAYEKEEFTDKLSDLSLIARKNNIIVNEFVIPDRINDKNATQQLFLENIDDIYNNQQTNYMYVAQCVNLKELEEQVNFINQFKNNNIVVGISKLSPINRSSNEAINIYKKCQHPIHFLGLKNSIDELTPPIKQFIRSCDTNLCEIIASEKGDMYVPGFVNYKRSETKNIDLEKSKTNSSDVVSILQQFKREVSKF